MGMRAARNAGNRPPAAPISAANTRPPASSTGVMRNLKATSLKLEKFVVPVDRPCTGSASRQPTTPPTSASATDSARNATTICARESERAQRADFAGAIRDRRVHRVHRAEHRADRQDQGDERPEDADHRRHHLRLVGVVVELALRRQLEARIGGDGRLERFERRRVGQLRRSSTESRCAETPASSARRRPRSRTRTPHRRR